MAVTEIIPPIDGEADAFGEWPAAWEFARLARASLDFETVTANRTVTTADHLLIVDATAGAITITLPAASTMAGRVVRVKAKSVSGGNITIDANAAETIDGAATLVLSTLYAKTALFCDGSTWWTI